MAECAFDTHSWLYSQIENNGHHSMIIICSRCRVGVHTEMTFLPHKRCEVGTHIFAAPGEHAPGSEVVMWAIANFQSQVTEMRDDGLTIGDFVPTIGGPPPKILLKHHSFEPL